MSRSIREAWQTVLAVDFDKWATETYRSNFPGVDVRTAAVSDIIPAIGPLQKAVYADVICGGFPCQPHSLAGKRLASADERDGGADFVAAIARVKPRMFLGENVAGLVSSEGGAYLSQLLAAMEAAGPGYVVRYRLMDAVNFGVPQFRNRIWFWGIRRDLYVDGIRHRWPVITHEWPPPLPSMFGDELQPGVTVGEALGLNEGELFRQRSENWGDRPPHPVIEPSPTINGGNGDGGSTGAIYLKSHADPMQSIDLPAPTLRSGGAGHDGCCVRIMGGGRNHPRDAEGNFRRDERDITEEPSTTIASSGFALTGGAIPRVHAYRWSDAMLAKHPPASPASPAPTVQAKYYKGGAEGLVRWKQTADGLWVRRLTPLECLRLQSGGDDFRWPDGISKTAMYRVVGNGWACRMGAVFADAFANADPDSHTLIDLYCGGGLGATGWHQKFWSYEQPAIAESRAS